MEDLVRQVRLLKIYAVLLTLIVITFMVLYAALLHNTNHFKEITAERINIVEPNGKLRMTISNHDNQHPGVVKGKTLSKRDRPAGMIFFNDEGDECGGLVYDGNKRQASMTYSIDQYQNDQIMQLQYNQDNNRLGAQRSYGFKLWDRSDNFPLWWQMDSIDSLKKLKDIKAYNAGIRKMRLEGALGTERLFLGRTSDGETGLFLRDNNGIPRLRICINKQNQPVIQTLNDKGEVIATR